MPPPFPIDVVLADPDRARRSAAAAVLRSVGWTVRELPGADEALAACREHPPTVVVVDAETSGDGQLRVLDELKSDPVLFAIGVVVRSRRLDVGEALDGLARGAHGMLVEPVADAELVAMVRSAARTGMLQAELRNRADALERLAFSDALTEIPNRRFLERQLEAFISSARRHGRPLSVALIDIDCFKAVNDAHGHAVGDEVISQVAQRLSARLRTEDHVGRFGGEEFLALLPDDDAEDAAAVAQDLCDAISSRPVMTAAGPLRVTVSVGWATWEDEPSHALIARADDAMYRAKADGRNLVRGPVRAVPTAC